MGNICYNNFSRSAIKYHARHFTATVSTDLEHSGARQIAAIPEQLNVVPTIVHTGLILAKRLETKAYWHRWGNRIRSVG